MAIIPWPAGRKPPRVPKPRKPIVNSLPRAILHLLVSDIPGQPNETKSERTVRFNTQLAEVMALNPRDTLEAMLAIQCVAMRLMCEASRRDAAKPDLTPRMRRTHERQAREFDALIAEFKQWIVTRQCDPPGRMDLTLCRAMGLEQFLVPDPDGMIGTADAVGAVIVPLHPAPRLPQ